MPPCAGDRNRHRRGITRAQVSGSATREGHQIFVDELTRFAGGTCDPRIAPVIADLVEPLRVAVRGRAGVGRRTVASALTGAGLTVVFEGPADVQVVTIAEAPKPEDRAMLADAAAPTLVVLNKADLSGFGAGGPIAVADRRAAEYRVLTGVATVPMVGLLAVASLDDELVAALRVLTTEAADLTSTDAFLTTDHPVARPVRARLLGTLDLFGIAHCVVALRRGAEQESLPALLRRLSLLDRVVGQLAAICAEVRYRRVRSAVARLRTMAPCGPPSLPEFLAGDDVVIAVMAAAVDVMRAAGLEVDPDDGPPAHLCRAVDWQRYGRGPVNQLHRSCAADISRGSLRLLRRAQAGTVTR